MENLSATAKGTPRNVSGLDTQRLTQAPATRAVSLAKES